tara:strand:+ start:13252 stop:14352 length:1101 start_codon:yes stop_codon:yes gene_type:complete
MKLGHIDSLNYYMQDDDSAFRLVNAIPPIPPAEDPGEEGMLRYNSRKQVFQGFINSEWSELVTDAALFGPGGSSGSGNVTKAALKNILGQLFKSTDGTIHVVHGTGAKGGIGDGYDIVPGEVQPLPANSHISIPPLAGNTLQLQGLWPQGGNNFIYCKNINSTRTIKGSVVIDFAKMFHMAAGPTAIASGGTGAEFIVGTIEGKIRSLHVKTAGSGYSVGDTIVIVPGQKWDSSTNNYITAGTGGACSVETVDGTGGVTAVKVDVQGAGYTPEEKFNYIYDVVSGLAGNSDATGDTWASKSDFSTHAVPAWETSPDMTLTNNTDHNYGKYMFSVDALANQTGGSGFVATCKFIVTLYKFKEFSNLV